MQNFSLHVKLITERTQYFKTIIYTKKEHNFLLMPKSYRVGDMITWEDNHI